MSKSTVRKEPTLADYSGDRHGASAANIADEFERFFAENARMTTPAPAVRPAPQPAPQPVSHEPVVVQAAPMQPAPMQPVPQQAAPAVPSYDDPLMAELARIVGPGAFARMTAPPAASTPQQARQHDPLAAFEEELRRFDAMHRAQPVVPEVAAVPAPAVPDPMAGLEAELARMHPQQLTEAAVAPEAELRGAQGDPINIPPPPADYAATAADGYAQDYQEPVPELAAPAAAGTRSRKVVMMLSAAAVIAVIGIVGAVVGRGGKKVAGEPPVIAAKTQPMKEKPADPGGAEIPGQDRQVLAKGQGEPAGAPKVVSKEEQPVDLAQTPKREVARVILPAPQGTGNAPAAAPILMPPAAQPEPAAAAPAPAAPTSAGGFEAKRVRSVRVGADGEAAVAARPVTPPAAAPAAVEPAPKPIAAAPTTQRIDPPKSESRPATAARATPPTTTPQPARTAARSNPAPAPAPAPAAEQTDENAPLSLRPPAGALATRPVARNTGSTTASTSAASTTSTGGGKFSVQLGAPPTQEEAQRMASRMKQQHSGALNGASPGVRAAKVGEKTVYRVRVGGLSRDSANTMCASIKSNGGSCFVASN